MNTHIREPTTCKGLFVCSYYIGDDDTPAGTDISPDTQYGTLHVYVHV